jgi:hypothetical protein
MRNVVVCSMPDTSICVRHGVFRFRPHELRGGGSQSY